MPPGCATSIASAAGLAIREGQRFVPLGDGSAGILPEDWIKRFGALAKVGGAGIPLRLVEPIVPANV